MWTWNYDLNSKFPAANSLWDVRPKYPSPLYRSKLPEQNEIKLKLLQGKFILRNGNKHARNW